MQKIIAFARLDIDYDADSIADEVSHLDFLWAGHFNVNHYNGKWEILSLRSTDGRTETIVPDMISGSNYHDTLAMDHCPTIKQLVASLHCDVMAVRLMNLPAGSSIKQHTDPELSFEQGEARLHFPIITNPQVDFRVEETRVYMEKGSAWYINANLPHSVSNYGDSDRIHLVIDCRVNEWVQILFKMSEKSYADEALLRLQQVQVIQELKIQGTAVAKQIAERMEKELNENE